MPKKEVVKLCEAFEKSKMGLNKCGVDMASFPISFTTDDLQLNTKDGMVSVTARITKEDLDRILYSYGLYIIDYFKEKGLIK